MSVELAPRTGLIGRPRSNGLDLPPDLTFDEWAGVVEHAEMIVDASPYSKGECGKIARTPRQELHSCRGEHHATVRSLAMQLDPTTVSPLPTAESWWLRFVEKVEVAENGCWLWKASIHPDGYGRFGIRNRIYPAHRVAYQSVRGEIPTGLCIDHVCHNQDDSCPGARDCLHRRCVNPWHLDVVTPGENVLRGQSLSAQAARAVSCKYGHLFSEKNVYVWRGERHCRICRLATQRRAFKRRVAARTA